MRIQRKLLDDALTLVVLFVATGAFQSLFLDPSDIRSAIDGTITSKIIWLVIYVAVVLRLIPHYREVVVLVRANKWLVLLVLLAISSVMWSEDPILTLRKGFTLLLTTLIGIDFAIRYSVRDQLRLLHMVLGLLVSLSVVAQVFFPTLIPGGAFDPDAWHGVFFAKNDFGRIVVLATIVIFSRRSRSGQDFIRIASMTLGAFVLVVLAQSKGALVVLIALLLLLITFWKIFGEPRWSNKTLAVVGLASALIFLPTSYLLFQNFDAATAVLGRSATLTGRVDIWRLAFLSIEKNPIQGYGYSAFWDAGSQAATRIREELNWGVPHAHNGYIDMMLELGLVGLLLFFAGFLIAARRALEWFQHGAEHDAMWPLIYLSFFSLYQITEGSLVAGNTIFWILYVAACFSVTKVTVADQAVLKTDGEFTLPIQMLPSGREHGTSVTS